MAARVNKPFIQRRTVQMPAENHPQPAWPPERKVVLELDYISHRFEQVRAMRIPDNVAPPFYFSAIVPGMKVNRTRQPLRFSAPAVKRPANLEEAAFWPVTHLAQLIKTRQASSLELTRMYLARLHKYNEKLNCVVTFLDDLALSQAEQKLVGLVRAGVEADLRQRRHEQGPLAA